MDRHEEPAAASTADALRRRLYRPGASDADLRRYTEAQDALEKRAPGSAVGSDGPLPPAPRGARRRRLLRVMAPLVAVALVAGVGLALSAHPAARSAATTGAAPFAPTRSPTPDRASGSATQAADGGGAPRAGATVSPTLVPVSLAGLNVVAQRFHGSGPATAVLSTAAASIRGGGVLLRITSASSAAISWRAIRPTAHSSDHIVALGEPSARRQTIAAESFPYERLPPSRIVVQAPTGVDWTLLVAFAGSTQPDMH